MTVQRHISSLSAELLPLAILLAFVAVSPFASRIELDETMPLQLPLSEHVSSWTAAPILFCQNIDCLAVVDKDKLKGDQCRSCGSQLDSIPLSEKMILPPDTKLFHQRYINDDGSVASVAVVVSGQSRSSMHKPEYCLPGQGFSINAESSTTLSLPNGGELKTRVLDVTRSGKSQRALFLYWFVSPTAQTASQVEKNWLMLSDRLLKGKIERWAYVSVLVPFSNDRAQCLDKTCELMKALYIASKPTQYVQP